MTRKIVFLITAFAVLFSGHMAAAQQAGKVWRIGYLSVRSAEQEKRYFPAFLQGLRELGYVEGKNIVIEARYAHRNNDRLSALAAERPLPSSD